MTADFVTTATDAILGDPLDPAKQPDNDGVVTAFEQLEVYILDRTKIDATNAPVYISAGGSGNGSAPSNALPSMDEFWDYACRRLIVPEGVTVPVYCSGALDGLNASKSYEGDGAIAFISTRSNILSAADASIDDTVAFLAQNGARFTHAGFDIDASAYGDWAIFHGHIRHYLNVYTGGPIHQYATRFGYIQMDGDTGVQADAQNHVQSSHHGNWRRDGQVGGTIVALDDHDYSIGFLYNDQGEICITGVPSPAPFNQNGKAVTGFRWLMQPGSVQNQWFGASAVDLATILGNVGPTVQDGARLFVGNTDIDRGKYGQAWTPFTPTATVGSGSLGSGNAFAGRYRNNGKTLEVQISASLGPAGLGTADGQLVLTLPAGFLSRDDTGGPWMVRANDFGTVNCTIGALNNLIALRLGNAFPLGNSQTARGTFIIETL